MRKLILYSAASIDNFIARAGGETDWLDSQEYSVEAEDFGYGEGPDIWLVGGGQINTHLLNNDLIDKLIITVIPLILGSGIPLFAGNSPTKKFRLTSSRSFPNGFVQLVYDRQLNHH